MEQYNIRSLSKFTTAICNPTGSKTTMNQVNFPWLLKPAKKCEFRSSSYYLRRNTQKIQAGSTSLFSVQSHQCPTPASCMWEATQLPAHPDGNTVSPSKHAASVHNFAGKPTSNRRANTQGIKSDETAGREKEEVTTPHHQLPKAFSIPSVK